MCGQIGVHPRGIPFQDLAALPVEGVEFSLSGTVQSDHPEEPVQLNGGLTHQLGKAARAGPALQFHLPYAVLGVDKSLGKE